jgi:hypothetical protein
MHDNCTVWHHKLIMRPPSQFAAVTRQLASSQRSSPPQRKAEHRKGLDGGKKYPPDFHMLCTLTHSRVRAGKQTVGVWLVRNWYSPIPLFFFLFFFFWARLVIGGLRGRDWAPTLPHRRMLDILSCSLSPRNGVVYFEKGGQHYFSALLYVFKIATS